LAKVLVESCFKLRYIKKEVVILNLWLKENIIGQVTEKEEE
jgi:hypothetical protein